MSTVLLDTNVVSFVFKGDTRARDYAPFLQGHRLALSFMTVAELYEWAAIRHWGDKRVASLEQTLSRYLVIPSDAALCRSGAHSVPGSVRAAKPSRLKTPGSLQRHSGMVCRSSPTTLKIFATLQDSRFALSCPDQLSCLRSPAQQSAARDVEAEHLIDTPDVADTCWHSSFAT
jgi:tRNA(fMet)-specific endonuclease VapC